MLSSKLELFDGSQTNYRLVASPETLPPTRGVAVFGYS